MPNWNQLLDEISAAPSVHDRIRRRYLEQIHAASGRNVIAYYSGWLQKSGDGGFDHGLDISDEDKNGLMTVIHKMDRSIGLDLVLHTRGGETAATESLVDYLRSMFGTDIRAIVPQIAMSGGTMISCACKEIVMGKQSSLGPIDPQFSGIAAHGVVEEFNRAKEEVSKDPSSIPIWQPIIAKYPPAFIGECEKAIAWSNEMARDWLTSGMFEGDKGVATRCKVQKIVQELGDHAVTKSHARHLSMNRCRDMGLKIVELEKNQELQEAVLSLHHACMLTFSQTPAVKIIENHFGVAFIKMTRTIAIAGPQSANQAGEDVQNEQHPAQTPEPA